MSKLQITLTLTLIFALGLGAGAFLLPSGPEPGNASSAPADAPPPEATALTVDAGVDTDPEDQQPTADADAAAVAEPEQEQSTAAPSAALTARLDGITAAWGQMQAELADLRQRVAFLESRPVAVAGEQADPEPRAVARTPEEQRDALVNAGVPIEKAEDLLWRRGQVSLQQLELRDRAIREGWLNSDRYRAELRRINEERVSLRDEVGADAYDRFLYETGEDNRIVVDSVIPGSAGEQNGLLPGDIVERYGDAPIFDVGDLRGATSEGARGELVPVQVRRGDGMVELWLPRGPIGIRLDSARVEPQG